ncbi:terminase large subunit domain-containing protein [Variovorax sp. UMC13]|uniref:terminase large subunit domain-containing protein n=1 Tax=Variovorax sp. UMC13 TaxID=1862326 RepID=UPI001600A58F|nr:terminase family protein [Variovorax sp. UMC13]MBB1599494.1 terminase [Variovorax sp. UMC13]
MQVSPKLNRPQARFLALPHKYRAFVAGFGSGKTRAGSAALCSHAWEWPKVDSGYFAPTYAQIRDIFYPAIEESAFDWGLTADIHESNKEVHLYSNGNFRGTILCRSMEKPGDIVGFKIGHAVIDELDVMKAVKAETAWRKIIARMRYSVDGLKNGVDVTTTPEGFKFVYQQFVKAVRDKPHLAGLYGLVHASTYENAKNLPADYISSLLASYPPQLIQAYIRGLFTNLTSGSVYPNFDRVLNHTGETIRPSEPLHVGLDFNVLNMTATVSVIRDDLPLTLEELTKVRDTPTMARMLKERFKDKGHAVTIYPDASGGNTSSKNASESDLSILKQAGFTISVNPANPAVKDRVNAVDAMALNADGVRRWKVNTDACPALTEAQEQQAWGTNGEPDKSTGHDHPNDAIGYFLVKRFPIVKRTAVVTPLRM